MLLGPSPSGQTVQIPDREPELHVGIRHCNTIWCRFRQYRRQILLSARKIMGSIPLAPYPSPLRRIIPFAFVRTQDAEGSSQVKGEHQLKTYLLVASFSPRRG